MLQQLYLIPGLEPSRMQICQEKCMGIISGQGEVRRKKWKDYIF